MARTDKGQERKSAVRTMRRVAPYLWPADESWVRRRVVLSLLALLIARVVSVSTPFFYKSAVDALGGEGRGEAWFLAMGAIGLTVAYGDRKSVV